MKLSRTLCAQLFQCISLSSYLIFLQYWVEADKDIIHWIFTLAVGLPLDYLLSLKIRKVQKFPWTAYIASCAIYMLMRTDYTVIPHLVAVIVAICSKYLIVVHRRHVFNPANIGLLFVFFLLPQLAVPAFDQWIATPMVLFIVIGTGLTVALLADRILISVTYLLSYYFLNFIYGIYAKLSIYYLLGPSIGFAGVIFAFHMISDPMTTPQKKRDQFLFGFAVAIGEFMIRLLETQYAPFLSLALVVSLMALRTEHKEVPKNKEVTTR